MFNDPLSIQVGFLLRESECGFLITNSKWPLSASVDMSEALRFKQQLFACDAPSFYGLIYHTETVAFMDNEGKIRNVTGVWLPFTQVMKLPSYINEWERRGVDVSKEMRSLANFFFHIYDLLEQKRFYPTLDGFWKLEEIKTLAEEHLDIPTFLYDVSPSSPALLWNEKTKWLNSFLALFDQWLQQWLSMEPQFGRWLRPYFQILDYKNDPQIEAWKNALRTNATYELSQHLYPYCLKCWNGKTNEPFQLVLLLEEPKPYTDDWSFELHLKEWETGNMYPLSSIYGGDNPFVKNPIPYIQQAMELLRMEYPLNQLLGLESGGTIPYEEVSNFLFVHAKKLENKGMSILVPQQLKESIGIPKITGTIHKIEPQPNFPIWRDTSISWTFLVNGVTIDNIQFKQWVEEKRQLIYINNHWIMWDLKLAEKLYHQYENHHIHSREDFFDLWRGAYSQGDSGHREAEATLETYNDAILDWTIAPGLLHDLKHSDKETISKEWAEKLRSYQRDGVKWLLTMRKLGLGACLADDMGLGKTIQAISYMDSFIQKSRFNSLQIKPFLLICPTSLLINWENEIKQFAPQLTYYVHAGKWQVRTEELTKMYPIVDVILTTYPIALRDIENLKLYHWDGLILDEAQMLKNVTSKQRKAIKQIHSLHTVALTGTPVENDPKELWSIMDLINPGYLRDPDWFHRRFLTGLDQNGKMRSLGELRTLIQPFLLRRTKAQFKEELALQDKIVKQELVPLYHEQKLLYEAVIQDLLDDYETLTTQERRAVIFKALTQLKQICNHPAHFLKEPHGDMNNRSGKWDACFRLLEENMEGYKQTLIFTQYRFMGELLRREMDRRWNMNTPFFHGQLHLAERQHMVNQFQEGETGPFLIISLRAGGTGLNLTRATEVIHYDRWWNPAVENQATDRVHRIGQKKEVTVTTFITENTLEEKIENLLQEKRVLQEELLNSSSSPLWKLSDDELKSLLSLRE